MSFETPDGNLASAFSWARQQALDYAFSGDPAGEWYEAALPGREAFCMRDVSHQSMGAQALGLGRYTLNMLKAFTANISDSKDWCSYWEINRYGRPAPVDYVDDARFWYDLPANFDVLDDCYRMYLWTGDLTYLNQGAMVNFYDRTVSDYVARWGLDLGQIMSRERIMNVRGRFDRDDKFQVSRGIPGYDEGDKNYLVGVDLLASEYAAYRAYSRIEGFRGNFALADRYAKKALAVEDFVNTVWWDEKDGHFYALLDENHHLAGRSGVDVLYYDVAQEGRKAEAALRDLEATIRANPSGPVELESHYPEVLYRYGAPTLAYSEIMDLSRKGRYRQEYPEVSFSVLGAIVTGLMGITMEAPPPEQSTTEWNYVEVVVKTFPSLTDDTAWARISDLPVRTNRVSVTHQGNSKTVLTNQSGPALIWQAAFQGAHETLLVNGQAAKASQGKQRSGRAASWVELPVGAGDTVTVEVPVSSGRH